MRTDFLFEYFCPSDVLKIGCFRYLTYQEKQKMFFFVLHFVVRCVQNLSRNRGEISSIVTLHLLWLRCLPGQLFQKRVSPKRHGRGSGNLCLQNRKSIFRVFIYSVVRIYSFCIEQKNLPPSEHQVRKLSSLRTVELKAFLHRVTWYKLDKNQISNLHNNQIHR